MVSKVCFRRARRDKRHQVNFSLANFTLWRDRHRRLFNLLLTVFVVAIVGITLIWQHPSIAQKLASAGLDDYFKQDVLDAQKDDADRDGLKDDKEAELKTDPNKPDTDGDGLLDGEEVNTYHTNPLAVDTDGDKFSDATEVMTGHDPNRAATSAASASGTAQNISQSSPGEVAAGNLDSVNQLLNGDTSTSPLTLKDFNVNNLGDVASLLGVGSRAEITVADSDIKIITVTDEESRGPVVQYFLQLQNLLLDVFQDEFKNMDAAQQTVMTSVANGQYGQLDAYTQKLEIYTDRAFGIAVPGQAKEFHKLFLKTLLETCALGKSLQRVNSGSADSLLALSLFDKMGQDEQTAEEEFNKLSTKYELGYSFPAPVSGSSQQ